MEIHNKMYLNKNTMPQIVPSGLYHHHHSTDHHSFAAYADTFDLSLLPLDGEVPHSPDSLQQLTIDVPILSPPSSSSSSSSSESSLSLLSSDYIPTTIFQDLNLTKIKTETSQNWSTDKNQYQQQSPSLVISCFDTDNNNNNNNNNNNQNNNNNTRQTYESDNILTVFPPSPTPSIENQFNQQHHHNQHAAAAANPHIKEEFINNSYHLFPPSPPESNGAPSPRCCDVKGEPIDQYSSDSETCIDIDSLLQNSFEVFEPNNNNISSSTSLSLSSLKEDSSQQSSFTSSTVQLPKDHQLLREYLQDTSFQRKHNLKPLALESLLGGWGDRGDIEPVISLALEHAKRDVLQTCTTLNISPDPQQWTSDQVQSWLQSTIEQFKLPLVQNMNHLFPEDGAQLSRLSDEDFSKRMPQAGGTLHAQLEVWKAACSDTTAFDGQFNMSTTSMAAGVGSPLSATGIQWNLDDDNYSIKDEGTDDEDEEMLDISSQIKLKTETPESSTSTINQSIIIINNDKLVSIVPTTSAVDSNETATISTPMINTNTDAVSTISTASAAAAATAAPTGTPITNITIPTTKTGRQGGSHIHLWQFLKELLSTPQQHGTAIRWLDRAKGVFKIEDSVRVARLWGRRKNRPAMNYDKLSRSIRQYYKKGIMKKTERSQRLVYQFCHPYGL